MRLGLWPGGMSALLAAAFFSLCAVLVSGQSPSFNGRFGQTANGAPFPQRFSWAASSMYVPFQDAQNITIAFSRVPGTGPSHFEIRVDSQLLESASTVGAGPTYVSVPLAGTGARTLTITKITEAALGEATVDNVVLDRGR